MRHTQQYIIPVLALLWLITVAAAPAFSHSQSLAETEIDSIRSAGADSVNSTSLDSLRADSTASSSTAMKRKRLEADTASTPKKNKIIRTKTDIAASVDISATDSLLIVGRNNAYLYGSSDVRYGEQEITAAQIELDIASNTVYAIGAPDSTGEIAGNPIFQDNGSQYEAKTMRYNFETEKGIITDVITEQGEGYITGGVTKKNNDGTFYLQNGRYTTCDDHEHPHFYFQLTKARVTPKKI